jgi:2-oxoglutarate dehydrogenase E1 component
MHMGRILPRPWATAIWTPSARPPVRLGARRLAAAPTDDLTAALTGEWPAAPAREAKAAAAKIAAKAEEKGVSLTDAQLQRAVLDSIRALMIIRAYRIRGHLVADLDPLGMRETTPHPELDPASYGFAEADMDRPIFIDKVLGLKWPPCARSSTS